MVKGWTLSKTRNKARMSVFIIHIHHCTRSHSQCNKIINQRHSGWKGRNKTISICTWQDCLHVDCKGIYKNVLSKVTGHKVKIQKSTVFLYSTNSEQLEANIKNFCTHVLPQKKYLGINTVKYIRFTCWKPQNTDERHQDLTNGEAYYIHGLEDSTE